MATKRHALYTNYVLLDKSGFDINMHRSRAWSQRDIQAIVESPSVRAISYTIIGAISAFGVVNVTIRDLGNIKKRKIVSATKRKASDVAAVIPKGIIKRTF